MLKDINDPAVEEEMERELNTIAKLDHENIVRIYGVFSVADTRNTGKLIGVFSKPSGDYIVVPNFCFLS